MQISSKQKWHSRWNDVRWRLVPLYVVGLLMLAPLAHSQWAKHRIDQTVAAAEARLPVTHNANKLIQGTPNRIVIPGIGLDLPIVAGSLSKQTGEWSVSDEMANYADQTLPLTSGKGQTLIYGHNKAAVFGKLTQLQKGAKVYVYTTNGHVFVYAFNESRDIRPYAPNLFSDLKKSTGIKLVTCVGEQFEYRRVLDFELLEAV